MNYNQQRDMPTEEQLQFSDDSVFDEYSHIERNLANNQALNDGNGVIIR